MYKVTSREYFHKKGKVTEEIGDIDRFYVVAFGLEDAMNAVKPKLGKHEDIDEVELVAEGFELSEMVKMQYQRES